MEAVEVDDEFTDSIGLKIKFLCSSVNGSD